MDAMYSFIRFFLTLFSAIFLLCQLETLTLVSCLTTRLDGRLEDASLIQRHFSLIARQSKSASESVQKLTKMEQHRMRKTPPLSKSQIESLISENESATAVETTNNNEPERFRATVDFVVQKMNKLNKLIKTLSPPPVVKSPPPPLRRPASRVEAASPKPSHVIDFRMATRVTANT
jgi:hypothetical protein